MKILSSIFLPLVLTFSAFAVSTNSKAPDFSLKGQDGKTYKLSDFKGKHVVLEWFNKECPYVKKHYGAGNMQALQKEFTKKGVVWLTIISSAKGKQGHMDSKEAKKEFRKDGAMRTALLNDESGMVGKKYGAKTTPHMYIINDKGSLVYQGAIDSNSSANPKTIAKAEAYVKNGLTTSLKGEKISKGKDSTKAYGCGVKYK